jgi:hypothetical protein
VNLLGYRSTAEVGASLEIMPMYLVGGYALDVNEGELHKLNINFSEIFPPAA